MSLDTAFQTFSQLETKNLILRRLQQGDASALYQILSDDQVTAFYDDDPFTDLSQASEQIKSWEYAFENRRAVRWGITRKGDGMVIGTCGYYGFHTRNLRASISSIIIFFTTQPFNQL